MLNFIIRRLGESVLVMLGVLLLTFVLFQMAAGDPAAAVLGKTPNPWKSKICGGNSKAICRSFTGTGAKAKFILLAIMKKSLWNCRV